jgi:hypothetical protein
MGSSLFGAPVFCGYRPVKNEALEGVQTGEAV